MAWLRREAFRTYAAICVSKATGSATDPGASANRAVEHRLDLVADEGLAALDDVAHEPGDRLGRRRHDGPAVGAGDPERERRAVERARVRGDEGHGQVRLAGQPADEGVDAVDVVELDAARVLDRGRERTGQVALGDLDDRPLPRRPADGVEVEAELEPVTAA